MKILILHTQAKNAFRLHFPCFKNKIPMSAAIDPVRDRNNNCENVDVKYYSYSIFFFFLAGLVSLYAFYSSGIAYAQDSDDEKENIEESQHNNNKPCFVSKSRVSKIKKILRE